MAQTGQLTLPAAKPWWGRLKPVTQVRIAIVVTLVVVWELVSASGLLYRDVVPSLFAIGKSLYATLAAMMKGIVISKAVVPDYDPAPMVDHLRAVLGAGPAGCRPATSRPAA